MFKAIILSPREIRVEEDMTTTGASILFEYSFRSCFDLIGTNGIPDPSLTQVCIVTDQQTLDAIEANPKYNVLISEEIINETS